LPGSIGTVVEPVIIAILQKAIKIICTQIGIYTKIGTDDGVVICAGASTIGKNKKVKSKSVFIWIVLG
jgi:hypothetical protein